MAVTQSHNPATHHSGSSDRVSAAWSPSQGQGSQTSSAVLGPGLSELCSSSVHKDSSHARSKWSVSGLNPRYYRVEPVQYPRIWISSAVCGSFSVTQPGVANVGD
ncbi:hypothetical protein FOXG_00533 [Fusarium oxysporum f. sp. lycopersici 4287]|uniref:Uncharacterized protein n=2 Tax=Fusarium oxysporum TaxID=5507 RepID=A0A0J9U6Q8_FUSO4|nr:hypothetical protein FOXG_00533 [Fusarium oxysporum f. sp. lycopersici 4287]KNA94532.1 hypothetical protein FOXG_00533 [Fusarium oxysporum f. sp. lycopersici 4287]